MHAIVKSNNAYAIAENGKVFVRNLSASEALELLVQLHQDASNDALQNAIQNTREMIAAKS